MATNVTNKHMPPISNPSPPVWPTPTLCLRVDDLEHEGFEIFIQAVNPKLALRAAVHASFKWLYSPETVPKHVNEVSLVLRSMPGVAYTTGTHTHKQIHFSLDYIAQCKNRALDEIMGVLVHEVVHCYQYGAHSTCPGGLIEGIADFVRLSEGLAPPHWKRVAGKRWDEGYDKTAYFLDWIERRYGDGTVQELNGLMKDNKYHRRIFREVTGRPVRKLWGLYCRDLEQSSFINHAENKR